MPFNSVFQGVPPFPWGAWAGVGTGADTVAAMTRSFFVGCAGGRGNGRGHGNGNDALGKGKRSRFVGCSGFIPFSGGTRAGAGTGADTVAVMTRLGGGNYSLSLTFGV